MRTGRPQPRCIMPDRAMRSRSWHPAQKAQSESAKEHPKQANIMIGVISFAHKKCKTGARGAARSSQKVRNVRTGRPQPRCIMPDRSMRSRSWHPAQKAHSESAKEHQKQAQIITGVISFAHTKYKTGAIGAARSYKKVRNVRTGRPQPRCIMPDRSMRSRSWHPAPKPQSESAEEHQKPAGPNNRCHFLRTQKVQDRCHRSRPIVTKGAQRAHGPSAAPMHHA